MRREGVRLMKGDDANVYDRVLLCALTCRAVMLLPSAPSPAVAAAALAAAAVAVLGAVLESSATRKR